MWNKIISWLQKYSNAPIRYIITFCIVVLPVVSLFKCMQVFVVIMTSILGVFLLGLQYLAESKNTPQKIREYLNDIENWDLGNLMYIPDSDCRMICKEDGSISHRYFNQIEHYQPMLVDLYLCEDMWEKKKNRMDCSVEEGFCFYDVEIYYRSSCIMKVKLSQILLKHYPTVGGCDIFYMPTGLVKKHVKTREEIASLPDFDICRILYKKDNNGEDGNNKVLNYLNYEYLANPAEYFHDNKDMIYAGRC